LDAGEAAKREPLLGGRGLLGAARFYDAQVDDARLTMLIARAAHSAGALVANYAEVCGLIRTSRGVEGAVVLDRLRGKEFEVRARVVINATGIWVDTVRQQDSQHRGATVRPTLGIHLIIPRRRLYTQHAVTFDSPRDGRHVFLIPWGDHALVGTTDTDYEGELENPAAAREDVDYLLEALAHVFPGAQIGSDDIISTLAGLRPLIQAEGGTYALSREHQISHSPAGLISVAGGKLTTSRLMAEQIVDRAERRLEREFDVSAEHPSRTKEPLPGSGIVHVASAVSDRQAHAHLVNTYGADAAWVLAYVEENPSLGERIVPDLPYLMAEVLYATQHEMALSLCDVMVRRTHVIHEVHGGGMDRARAVAEMMAPRLAWDAAEVERQIDEYATQVGLTQVWRSQ
jgi:glycerol-3-phosphate dehydrogenase